MPLAPAAPSFVRDEVAGETYTQTAAEGFTLVELMMVVTIVGGFSRRLAIPSFQRSVIKAREGRSSMTWPPCVTCWTSIGRTRGPIPSAGRVSAGGLSQADSRRSVYPFGPNLAVMADEGESGGIADIHSGSPLVGPEGHS